MDPRITRQFSKEFKVYQQCNNVLIGIPGFICPGVYYNIKLEVTPEFTPAYGREHGKNNTVDTLPLSFICICSFCGSPFDETEALARHHESPCDNNGAVPERYVNVNIPRQTGNPNHHHTSTLNQFQTNSGTTGVPAQRYRPPPQASVRRHRRPQQQNIPRTTAAPIIPNRTGVQRFAGHLQPSAVAPCQAFPGSSSCNDRNKQRHSTHACSKCQKAPPARFPHNNGNGAPAVRAQLQSLEGRNQNQIRRPNEVENIRVQTEVVATVAAVLVPPGPSIRAPSPIFGSTQDRSRSRVRERGRHKNVSQHARNPSNNNESETPPTSFQFPCRISDCTRTINTITELTDHTIDDHDLEHRRYWELNPKPKCLTCGAETDDFKEMPSEFFRHVFECKRLRKEKEPRWNPRLSKPKHGMPRDWDDAMWYCQVHKHLETKGTGRKRTRSASATRSKAPFPTSRVLRSASQNRGNNAPSTGVDVNPLPASASPPFDVSSSIMPPANDLQNIHHLSPAVQELPLRQYEPRQSSMKQSSKKRKM